MGSNYTILRVLLCLLCAGTRASPRSKYNVFLRSGVETIPDHEPIAVPIRASVESIPLRSLYAEDERLPLRDAVEKRPISILEPSAAFKFLEESETSSDAEEEFHYEEPYGVYYGAASHLNNSSKTQTDERLQQGNANLQEMQQTSDASSRRLVVCYLESWAAYRTPPLSFTPSLVPKSCTHLHYAFAQLHPHTYAVTPGNEHYDIVKGGYRTATGLKRRIPGLRVLISVGGDGTGRLFSEMVQESNRRSSFIDSAVKFLREHDFDGLDLHWVYPGEKDEKERELLTNLLYELREKFSSYGLLLSTVLPPFRYQIEDGYDLRAVSGAADYAVLQAWDMTPGKREEPPKNALQHSALHKDPGAASRNQRYDNIEFVVKYILRNGMSGDKLVLGVPLFGRSYTLAASTEPSPGAPVVGWGDEGPYTQTKGKLAYFEICMAERENKSTSATDEAGNSYSVFENQWVTYDTPSNVLEKMQFVMRNDLAGAAAWAVDMDDFRGLCGSPYPMLSAISTSLNGESVQSDQSSLKLGNCDPFTRYLASDEKSCAHFLFCSGGINYRLICEDDRLYDPSTGFCGHQDVAKCVPGQSLRINVNQAARYLTQLKEQDFEWGDDPVKHFVKNTNDAERIISWDSDIRQGRDNNKRVVCYMTSWAFYRRSDGKFVPENIDTRLCTHVVYAYASLSPDDLVAKEFDPWADITNNLYERVTSLKDVKVLLGIGGWTDSSGDKYSRLVSSDSARNKFISRVVDFLRMHNFKGLQLDWNYPVCWQSNCKKGPKSDKQNFARFVEELAEKLHENNMELGVALSGYKEVIESAYNLPAISKAADYLTTMTYDYHGGWERMTAHHTPLTPRPNDALPHYSIEYAIKALIENGADPKKLLLGLSFYGQSYRLATTEGSAGPGSPAAGPGEPGEYTKQPGMLAYYEICYRVNDLRWKTGYIEKAGPYAYFDNQWVGYDDPKSIKEKVEWAMRQGMGGVVAWAIDLDDFNNRCCSEPSPLLRAAGRALGRSVPPPPAAACERPPAPATPAPPSTTPAESDGSLGSSTGSHDHHHGQDHQSSTTWGWNPAATTPSTSQTWWSQDATSQTWWAQPATTQMTTSTTTSTTRRPPTQAPTTTPSIDSEGAPCTAGEYSSAAGDCESYLQCEGGQWNKQRCAPGLHWSASTGRCDWPAFAKCDEANQEASTTTSTPRPITTPSTTTTRRTTTARRTTTTARTTTTTSTTPSSIMDDSYNSLAGQPCNGQQDYDEVSNDCGAYLHCDGSVWKLQKCAPGLHWSQREKHCDWPKIANCRGADNKPTTIAAPRPTRPPATQTSRPTTGPTEAPSDMKPQENDECGFNDMHAASSTCDSYLLCVSGRWRKQLCPPGLHWDKRTSRCDWVEFAMCEMKSASSKSPMKNPTTFSTTRRPMNNPTVTTTRRPAYTTSRKPSPIVDVDKKPENCQTGSYYAHQKCEKFFVCVNGVMIAQSCAPGLVWNPDLSQCDFPSAKSCSDRRQVVSSTIVDGTKPQVQQDEQNQQYCNSGEYSTLSSDCTRYRHCIFGRFEIFSCSAGLHWNQEKQICDWPKNAKCKNKKTPMAVKPIKQPTSKPVVGSQETRPAPAKPVVSKPPSITSVQASKPQLLNSQYKLICYYTNWSWYRPGLGKYSPEDIDPTLCTHIIYGFAVLGKDGLMTAHDSWADYDNRFYERVVEYKRYGAKISLALGGWNDSADDKYSKLVNDPAARSRFVSHALEFVQKYGFDGLDLDWEYPKCWQVDCSKGPDSDKEGFAYLVQELSAAFKPRGLLLSSAVSPNKKVIDEGYDVPVLARHLDWIAVMTYDYHGQWDKKTGHVAPLYYHPDDDNTYFNANYTMNYWMKKGAPASKLVMGIPMYGQSFTLGSRYYGSEGESYNDIMGLNIPSVSGGEAGEYTRAKGFLAYYEICDRIRNQGWQVVRDPLGRMGPYTFKGNQWVSFDDQDIIKKKANFIKSLDLAGAMVWALDLDDFRNRCGQGKHPLLNTIKTELLNPNIDLESPNQLAPVVELPNSIDEEFEDIQVRPNPQRPGSTTTVRTTVDDIQVRPNPQRPSSTMTVRTTVRPATTYKPTTVTGIEKEDRYKVVCYYTNWSWYRSGSGKYTPSDIEPSLCTHIVYAFAVLDNNKLVLKPHDTSLDVENKFYEKVVALKSKGVKVVLGLGGWNDSAGDKYSRLVNSPSTRRKFIVHTLDFLGQYGFDGLDLDWEYPRCWQVNCEKGPSSDKQGFADLVSELRSAFAPRRLLLSAAVSASKRVIDFAYDVPTLSNNLDWIALMTYDYHGQWEKKTGHVAPMYAREDDTDRTFNTNFTVHYWISKGADPQKLVMGVPLYGQSFTLVENFASGLGAPSVAGGEAGEETRARGFLAFYEICERIRTQGWKVTRDPGGTIGPYAAFGNQWVSFDDDVMVRHKAEYVRALQLGGSMVWALDLDDFNGEHCGCGKSPLLRTVNYVLRNMDAPPRCDLKEIQEPQRPENEPSVETTPDNTDVQEPDTEISQPALEGTSCRDATFKADDFDCRKYYLCINGVYIELNCPEPLVWNQRHCDWPEKSNCKIGAHLRLTDENNHDSPGNHIVACYFTNWAYYRRNQGRFGPDQIDSSLCSHVIYAWAHLDPRTYEIVAGIPELDIDNDFFGKISQLRLKGVKVIIGVGGLEDSDSSKWNKMVSERQNRQMFVKSAIKFVRKWGFDGLQIAWQYPVCRQVPCYDTTDSSEKENFSILLLELSGAFRAHDLELSAMVSNTPEIASVAYDNNVLAEALDWISIAANDYYAASSSKTSYLVSLETDDSGDSRSFNSTLAYWVRTMPGKSLVVGVPAYARTYTLRRASHEPAGAPAAGPGVPGDYTGVPGFLAFYEICTGLKTQDWKETKTEKGTYAVRGAQWASYLRPEELHRVGASVQASGARGVGLWALDLDDWRGYCGCGARPLLTSLRQGLFEPAMPSSMTCERN